MLARELKDSDDNDEAAGSLRKRGKDEREGRQVPSASQPSKKSIQAISSSSSGNATESDVEPHSEEQHEADMEKELQQRRQSYRRGTDSLRAQVLGLISQSQSGTWVEAAVPPTLSLDFPKVSVFYKTIADETAATSSLTESPHHARLHTRADLVLPGADISVLADAFWRSFSSTSVLQKRYKGHLEQLAEDTIDSYTKMGYYREGADGEVSNDIVLICNRSVYKLKASSLRPCPTHGTAASRLEAGSEEKMHEAQVLVMSLTQHSVAPQHLNLKRVTRLYLQGVIIMNLGASLQVCFVQSIPCDTKSTIEKSQELAELTEMMYSFVHLGLNKT